VRLALQRQAGDTALTDSPGAGAGAGNGKIIWWPLVMVDLWGRTRADRSCRAVSGRNRSVAPIPFTDVRFIHHGNGLMLAVTRLAGYYQPRRRPVQLIRARHELAPIHNLGCAYSGGD
jgi:hypothetical protein